MHRKTTGGTEDGFGYIPRFYKVDKLLLFNQLQKRIHFVPGLVAFRHLCPTTTSPRPSVAACSLTRCSSLGANGQTRCLKLRPTSRITS
ncbi:hypothetical protein VTI28DRAFT_1403 [Corynascus sepedonium]